MRTPHLRLLRRSWTAALAAAGSVALLVSGSIATPTSAAGVGCRVDYTVNQWAGGYTAQVKVTHLGPAVNGWRLTWTHADGQRVTSAWNATVTQTGASVVAVNTDWNGSLATDGSAEFGVQGTWSSANPAPTDFALNGVVCGGTGTTPSGAWQFAAPDCQGTGTAAVDTSVAHSGGRSLRIDGRAGYCNHAFVASTANLSSVGPLMHVRMWVRHTTALPAAHVTFVSLPDSSQGGRALRVGGQNGALQWNRETDDATLPAQSPAGVAQSRPLPTGSWQCLRFAIDTTAPKLDTWLGDEQIPGLHADGVPTQDIDQQWLART
ncbi:cellulose-binding protein, partial [Streptomyces sp. NTH33]|uniref:cellulose-binding domain-containing protein n=1 Tax=Streptomyces sp. NTH33 TaxID=1735453 RepID=UPI000DA90DCD